MAASFPTSVPSFVDLVDNQDDVLAAHQNDPNDEIEALATLIGATGTAQSRNTDVLAWLLQQLPTIKLSYVDGDTVQASAGVCVSTNSGGTIRQLRRNTSTTNITFANIDDSSEAASTEYYVWAVADANATTLTFVISASASAPQGGDETHYVLIGGFYNNSSSDVEETTVWSIAGMRCVNAKHFEDADLASGTTNMIYDNSIPPITEGDEYMQMWYAPQNANNYIHVMVIFHGYLNADDYVTLGLFKQGTTDALKATSARGNYTGTWVLHHWFQPGSLDAIDFRVRAGRDGSGTLYFNGAGAGTGLYGGVSGSMIIVKEYEK